MAVSQDLFVLKDYAAAMGVRVTLSKTNAVSIIKSSAFSRSLWRVLHFKFKLSDIVSITADRVLLLLAQVPADNPAVSHNRTETYHYQP